MENQQKATLQGLVLQACSDLRERHAKCSEIEVQVCSAKLRYGNNVESFEAWRAKTRVLNLILDAARMTKLA